MGWLFSPPDMPFLLCPSCGGDGSLKGATCPTCHGDARFVVSGDRVLFWGKRISDAGIVERKTERLLDGAVLMALAGLGLLGVAAVGFEAYLRGEYDLMSAAFWGAPSARLFFFYLTIWSDAYLVSRVLREADRVRPVVEKPYGQAAAAPIAADFASAAKIRGRRRVDISGSFTAQALGSVERAYELAKRGGYGEATDAHLLAALLTTDDVMFLFARLGIESSKIVARLKQAIASAPPSSGSTSLGEGVWEAIFDAYSIAYGTRSRYVRPLELFLAVASKKGKVQDILFDLGADESKLKNVTAWLRVTNELRERWRRGRKAAARRPKGTMNRAMTAIATPALDRLSEDYTLRAAYGAFPPFVDREKEMAAFFRTIEGSGRPVVLVGEPGTGKEAFLEGLAVRMAGDDVPDILKDKRLVALSVAKLVAGAGAAEAAERIERVFYEVAVSRNVVLAIPDVEGLIGISAGSGGGIDLSEVLETNVSKLRVLAVATTTPEAYSSLVERSAVGRSFEKLELPEVDTDGAIQICEAKAGAIEAENGVWFSYDAIEKAVTLSDRYMHDRYLPEKAIQLLLEVAYAVAGERGKGATVGGEDVAKIVSEKAKVPVTAVTESESEKLLTLEARMHGRVVGQDEAVSAVAKAIRRARTELRAGTRPIANFLFLGPTGVGKTELAKTVAETYFVREDAMVRLDMSEYQGKDSVNRMIGAPGGEAGGVLTEAVRKRPSALLLLDEIEKAHPDILNLFLQVMDDGRLTDNVGRTVDFTNVILVATSNAGSQFIQDSIRAGEGVEEIRKRLVEEELKGTFRPEFLNRFDGVIVFRPLTPDDVAKIARLMLIGIARQLEVKQIYLQATDEAVAELAAAGYDPAFGARPLRRVMQERVQDLLAQGMLEGKISRRDTVILDKGGTYRVERNG